jgi:hypothetical protein
VRLSRCDVRDHMNDRKNDRWPSYRFYRALQRLKSPTRYICEIFGAPRFSSFSTQSAMNGHAHTEMKTSPAGAYYGLGPFLMDASQPPNAPYAILAYQERWSCPEIWAAY